MKYGLLGQRFDDDVAVGVASRCDPGAVAVALVGEVDNSSMLRVGVQVAGRKTGWRRRWNRIGRAVTDQEVLDPLRIATAPTGRLCRQRCWRMDAGLFVDLRERSLGALRIAASGLNFGDSSHSPCLGGFAIFDRRFILRPDSSRQDDEKAQREC